MIKKMTERPIENFELQEKMVETPPLQLVEAEREWEEAEQLPGVETFAYIIKELPPLNGLQRDAYPLPVQVHFFDKRYTLKSASGRDYLTPEDTFTNTFEEPVDERRIVDLLDMLYGGQVDEETLERLKRQWPKTAAGAAALAGGTAASSQEKEAFSVIKMLNSAPSLKSGPEDNYGLFTEMNGIEAAVGFQGYGLPFNDGAARWGFTEAGTPQLTDLPLQILQDMGMYHQGSHKRVFIGTTQEGVNKGVVVYSGEELATLQAEGFRDALGSWPTFIENGHVNSPAEILRDIGGDPRHYYRVPFAKRPIGLEMFAQMARMHPDKMSAALLDKEPIEIPLSTNWSAPEAKATLVQEFKNDKVYGPDFDIKVDEERNVLQLPYLEPAPYNHLMYGVDEDGQSVILQIGGRQGPVTGQFGLTVLEIPEMLKQIQDKSGKKIMFLVAGSQGRDPDNVLTYKKNGDGAEILDYTHRPGSRFNVTPADKGGDFNRNKVTTNRDLLVLEEE